MRKLHQRNGFSTKLRREGIWLLAVVLITIVPIVIRGQPAELVELKAKLNKDTYYLGEPVFIELKIKNLAEQLIEFSSILNPRGDLTIRITKPGHLPMIYYGHYPVAFYPATVLELPPGQTRHARFIILYDDKSPQGMVFAEPGRATIEIRLRYNIDRYAVRTEILLYQEIEIKEPQGNDKPALSLIFNKSCMEDLHKGAGREENKPIFLNLVKKYPRSLYAPYCLFTLAGGEASENNPRRDYEKAINLFKELLQKYPKFYLNDIVYYSIAVCYDVLTQEREAKKWLARLYNGFPDSSLIARNDPYYWRYFFKKYDPQINPPDSNWMLFQPEEE